MSKPANPFRYFNSSPEVIRLVVMMYVRFPLSLRNVEDLLFERGIDLCHETVRMWWGRFGPMFASDIRRARVSRMRGLALSCLDGALRSRVIFGIAAVAGAVMPPAFCRGVDPL